MANRMDDLKKLLLEALESPDGTILRLSGGEAGRKQAAIAALSNARRDLQVDVPEIINVQIKSVPGKENEIALLRTNKE